MIFLHFLLLLSRVVAFHSLNSTQPRCHPNERSALLEFKATFFTQRPPCCYGSLDKHVKLESWRAVGETTSNCFGHVIGLDVSCSCVSGSINSSTASILSLVHLQSLNLAFNDFNFSQVPLEIGDLSSLRELNLSYSYFIGHIPTSLGNLTQLTHLDLSLNAFLGSVQFIKNLTLLTHLDLSSNSFSGKIPSILGRFVRLKHLDLGYNDFMIGSLMRLTDLVLSSNRLTSKIPFSLGSLTQLTDLILSSNRLTGEIPFSLGSLTQLIGLGLSSNRLTGKIPFSLGSLTQLTYLDLSSNQLTREIPSSFQSLQELQSLDVNSNELEGEMPTWLGSLAQLSSIDFSNNSFHGSIPSTITHLQNLRSLDLSSNNLSGTVELDMFSKIENLSGLGPVTFKWRNLEILDLRFNQLQGSLPIPPLKISHCYISNNRLSGEISPIICNLIWIKMINLSNNNLIGVLPRCLSNLSGSLEVMSLQSNGFNGEIPQLNGDHCAFLMIDLSYNEFMGPLPRLLLKCKNLEFLNFGNNQIRDIFPSFHGLVGEPTDGFEFPKLHIIDLSQNNLSGSLPSGYFEQWTAMKVFETNSSSYIGDAIMVTWVFSPSFTFDYSMRVIAKGIHMNYSKIRGDLTLIDLSSNKFNGAIPKTIGSLKNLRLLNLSNN
ncbi:hypothetical protein BT93_B1447 [Corymbia citriodora subsp. variegata]|nr:hypothetical protein BT93_B1447 [Corymbia citriodora subsp. variegata]